MKRSVNSVNVRMKRLGLKKADRVGWYTLREVCEILGRDHRWVRKRIETGALLAQRHHGLHKTPDKCMWCIGAKALRNFIRRYPQDLDGRNVDLITVVHLLAGLQPPSAHDSAPPKPENPVAAADTTAQEDGSP